MKNIIIAIVGISCMLLSANLPNRKKLGLLAAVTPKGVKVYVCNGGKSDKVPNLANKNYIISKNNKAVAVSFRPTGRQVAVASKTEIVIYDALNKRKISSLDVFGKDFKNAMKEATKVDLSLIKKAKKEGKEAYFFIHDLDWINQREIYIKAQWNLGESAGSGALVYNLSKKSIKFHKLFGNEGVFDDVKLDGVTINEGNKKYKLTSKEDVLLIEGESFKNIQEKLGRNKSSDALSLDKADFISIL